MARRMVGVSCTTLKMKRRSQTRRAALRISPSLTSVHSLPHCDHPRISIEIYEAGRVTTSGEFAVSVAWSIAVRVKSGMYQNWYFVLKRSRWHAAAVSLRHLLNSHSIDIKRGSQWRCPGEAETYSRSSWLSPLLLNDHGVKIAGVLQRRQVQQVEYPSHRSCASPPLLCALWHQDQRRAGTQKRSRMARSPLASSLSPLSI